jgi:general secretion pathway protein G
MVVVVILGILAAILVPKVMDRPDQARIIKARQDIRALEAALDRRPAAGQGDNKAAIGGVRATHSDPGKILTCIESLRVFSTWEETYGFHVGWKEGGYIDRLPLDPWKQPYQYLSPGVNASIDIYSLGPDQQPSDDDIGNWQPQ